MSNFRGMFSLLKHRLDETQGTAIDAGFTAVVHSTKTKAAPKGSLCGRRLGAAPGVESSTAGVDTQVLRKFCVYAYRQRYRRHRAMLRDDCRSSVPPDLCCRLHTGRPSVRLPDSGARLGCRTLVATSVGDVAPLSPPCRSCRRTRGSIPCRSNPNTGSWGTLRTTPRDWRNDASTLTPRCSAWRCFWCPPAAEMSPPRKRYAASTATFSSAGFDPDPGTQTAHSLVRSNSSRTHSMKAWTRADRCLRCG